MHTSLVTCFAVRLLLLATLPAAALAAERSGSPAIFKSTDRGRSWSRSDDGLPGNSRINVFGALDESLFAGTDSGVFISRDQGRSWQPSAGAARNVGRILCLAILGRNVYAGTDRGGLILSSDKGRSWSDKATVPAGLIRCLLGHEGRLYAGADAGGVFVSEDGGERWARMGQGLPAHAQVSAMSVVKGRLFAGLYSNGLYGWDDRERRWTKAGGVFPLVLASIDDTLVVGHNPGGIHWSNDLGATWFQGTADATGQLGVPLADGPGELSSDAPVWEMAAGDGIVFAGASDGIYYSEDRGRTWVRARTGLPAETPGVSFLVKGNLVLAGTLIKGVGGERGGDANGSQPGRSK